MKRIRPTKAKAGKGAAAGSEEVTGEEARDLKSRIESAGGLDGISDAELLRVIKADTPCAGLYAKSCKGKGSNPNCLCSLIPAPEGYRRQGLWAKEADVVGTLGPDPAANERKNRSQPVGLKNLGNTCYVNSVLQCLFANAAFRRAVYALRQPLADEPIVKELRELFFAMEFGCTDPVHPEPLAKALNLDNAVQQDGQEFMKLFLSLLEARFGRQPEVGEVIQELFRGSSGYLTTCLTCQQPSESSARSDNFYEVDVPVQGFKSLQESLCSMLLPERMEGPNQYSCEYCNAKVDATRQLELRALPPMLCFSLQRFVFDFGRMDRVKVSDRFAFPLTLDLAPITGQPAGPGLVYDLEAIMVHKGGSATQGHYVAHIKLEGRPASTDGGAAEQGDGCAAEPAAAEAKPPAGKKGGRAKAAAVVAGDAGGGEAAAAASPAGGEGQEGSWWRFDDETVTEMRGGPTASTDHGGAAKGGGAAAAGEGRGRGRGGRGRGGKAGRGTRGGRGRGKRAAAGSSGEDDAAVEIDSGSDAEADPELAAALRASMGGAPARPKQRKPAAAAAQEEQAQEEQQQGAGQQQEIVSSNAYLLVYRRRGAALPLAPLDEQQEASLAAARAQLEEERQRAASAYAAARQELLAGQAARQAEVRAVVEAAAALDPADPGRFVAAEWLTRWADAGVEAAAPDPIDNSPLLCPHGRLDPAKVPGAMRVSSPAWEQLRGGCKGGPELGPRDVCPACLAACLDAVVAKEDTQGRREHFMAVAAVLLKGEGEGQGLEPAFYVSQTWLGSWLRQRKGSMGGTSPTKDITCPCGNLAPEGSKTRRVAIPQDFWRFLQRSWQAACVERRAKEAKRALKAGGGGAGQAWDLASPPAAGQAGEPAGGADDVICLDSPTAAQQQPAAAAKRPRRGAAAASASAEAASEAAGSEGEVVEVLPNGRHEQQQGAAAPAAKQEDAAAAAALAAAARREAAAAEAAALAAAGKQEVGGEDDVVMLDGDEEGAGTGGGNAAVAAAGGGGDGGGGGGGGALLEFGVGCPECAACAGRLKDAHNTLKGLQGRLAEEKSELSHLLQAGQPSLAAGHSYRLVPSAFMQRWRAYMQQAGRRGLSPAAKAAEIVQPPSLAEALLGVLCECHRGGGALPGARAEGAAGEGAAAAGGLDGDGDAGSCLLGYPPPAVVNRRGRWTVDDDEGGEGSGGTAARPAGGDGAAGADGGGVFEVLAAPDWYALSAYYGPEAEGGGGGRKRRRPQAELSPQLEALLEGGIEATLVVQEAGAAPATAAAAEPGAPPATDAAPGSGQRGEGGGQGEGRRLLEEQLVIGDESNPYKAVRRPNPRLGTAGVARLVTQPRLCQRAVAERRALLRATRLSYTNEEIVVELVGSVEEASAARDGGGSGERKSKRARKGRAPLLVSSGDTLQQLRFHVLQNLEVHPANAQLFLRGVRLSQGEDATLADCEVYPGDEIKVVDSGEHDSSDLASLFPAYAPKGGRRREAERGFTGTALTGLVPAAGTSGEEGGGGGIDVDAELAAAAAQGGTVSDG